MKKLNEIITATLPHMPQRLVWVFSKKYIAGVTAADAVAAARAINGQGAKFTLDILGEFISSLSEARANKEDYIALINTVEKEKLDGNYSLKPTMLGLLIDPAACYRYVREIVATAAAFGNFIRIDMEDSQCVDLEIELFRKLKAEFPAGVGLVVQAYLKRTRRDIIDLMDLHSPETPLNLRLCKGIYTEPPEIAFQSYREINAHFLEDLELMLENGVYPGIATHDKPLVTGATQLLEKYHTPVDRYEFQMLYGVTPDLRQSIVTGGHTMRVYVPFGKEWFGYSTRRLKENPKIAGHIVKALFLRG
jgi:proline dehydrogenase